MNAFELVKSSVTVRDVAEYYGLKVNRNGMASISILMHLRNAYVR